MIYVTINGSTEVLIDGVMTDHQLTPGSGGHSPVLTITGEDLTRVMDYIDFTGIALSRHAARSARAADSGQVRDLRRDSDGDPEHHARCADSDRPHPGPTGQRPGVCKKAGR